VLRLGLRGNPALARLEIFDAELAAAIDARAAYIDRAGIRRRRQRASVIGWSIAATVSLVLVAMFGIPAIAGKLAPLVPGVVDRNWARRWTRSCDPSWTRAMPGRLSNAGRRYRKGGPRRARQACASAGSRRCAAGAAAQSCSAPVRSQRHGAAGRPDLCVSRLIDKADSADEVAGVVAHEIGHVAHRDGTRAVLQAGGLSFMFGMLLGDFVGGGAVVIAAKSVLQSSYSRETEASADAYGTELMIKAHGNAHALGVMLAKVAARPNRA